MFLRIHTYVYNDHMMAPEMLPAYTARKVVPLYLTKHYTTKTYRENKGEALSILTLGARWR